MKKTYDVVGRYPAFRPQTIGSTVELTEEAARYHLLDGTLQEAAASTEPAPTKRKVEDK